MPVATPQTTMIYTKTEAGQQAFKQRLPLLSARQRTAFILFDGVKPLAEVLAATAGIGVTQADVDHMLSQGLIETTQQPTLVEPARRERTPQERYSEAYPIATRLTASLGLRGFKLNLAVEAAGGYEDLLALLPKIQEAVGVPACQSLEAALTG